MHFRIFSKKLFFVAIKSIILKFVTICRRCRRRVPKQLFPVCIKTTFFLTKKLYKSALFPASFCLFPSFQYSWLYTNVPHKSFPMTGFEPRTSGVGSDRSTNWATTTAPKNQNDTQPTKSLYLRKIKAAFCLEFHNLATFDEKWG